MLATGAFNAKRIVTRTLLVGAKQERVIQAAIFVVLGGADVVSPGARNCGLIKEGRSSIQCCRTAQVADAAQLELLEARSLSGAAACTLSKAFQKKTKL
jgi:hypothetical protein